MTTQDPKDQPAGVYGDSQNADRPGSTSINPDLGTAENDTSDTDTSDNDTSDAAVSLDDTDPSGQAEEDVTFSGNSAVTYGTSTYGTDEPGTVDKAKDVAGQAAERAADVKDSAVVKAGEVKDLALERGGDVAAVAKDELAKLTQEARGHAQDLWSQASSQLRDQVDTGRHQLAELLQSLTDELGELVSNTTQSGPITSLAKQAHHRGGELSHWLANTEPADLLTEIRRFARRRPAAFLGGAALAGVLVGRLSRGLMAAAQDSDTTSSSTAPGTRLYSDGDVTYGAVAATDVQNFGTDDLTSTSAGSASKSSATGDTTDGGWR